MKRKILILFIVLLFLSMNVSAEAQSLGYFERNKDVLLIQTCQTCSFVNITTITYPNRSIALSNIEMTKDSASFSYLLSGNYTTDYGRYIVCGFGTAGTFCYDFFVNGTGREDPSGSVLTFFIIFFLLILGLLLYMFIYSFGHFIKKDFDLIDLAMDFGIYFVLVAFYILQAQYVGSELMDSILYVLVIVGAFTHVFGSLLFFMVVMIYSSLEQQKQMYGFKT